MNINVAWAKPLLLTVLAPNDNENTVKSKETVDEEAPKEVVELITSKKPIAQIVDKSVNNVASTNANSS